MTDKEIDAFVQTLSKKKNVVMRKKGSSSSPTKQLNFRYSMVSFYPDIELDHDNQTDLYTFEKEFNSNKLGDLITKWIMFSIHARMKSGKYYIVCDEKNRLKFQEVIDDKSLEILLVTV